VTVHPTLRRAGIVVTGFVIGWACGVAHAPLLFSFGSLALTTACVEVTARLNEEE
jgi:hypothetical protein